MIGVVFHQGSRSSRVVSHQRGRSSGSSIIRVVVHHREGGGGVVHQFIVHLGGLSSAWSFIGFVYRQGSRSSREEGGGGGGVVHQLIVQQGGRSSVNLSSEWSPIRVVAHQLIVLLISQSFVGVVSHQGDPSSADQFIGVVSQQGGRSSVNRSSGWSPIRVVVHQLIVHQSGLPSG